MVKIGQKMANGRPTTISSSVFVFIHTIMTFTISCIVWILVYMYAFDAESMYSIPMWAFVTSVCSTLLLWLYTTKFSVTVYMSGNFHGVNILMDFVDIWYPRKITKFYIRTYYLSIRFYTTKNPQNCLNYPNHKV